MERLPDLLESVARLRVKVAGVLKGTRREVDFTSGDSSVTITATDDGVNEKLTLDLSAGGTDLTNWLGRAVADIDSNGPSFSDPGAGTPGTAAFWFLTYTTATKTLSFSAFSDTNYLTSFTWIVDETGTTKTASSSWDAETGNGGKAHASLSCSDDTANNAGAIAQFDLSARDDAGTGATGFTIQSSTTQIVEEGDAPAWKLINGVGTITVDSKTGALVWSRGGDIEIDPRKAGSGYLVLKNLPTSNPGGTGRVWNNLGILSIT